MQKIEHKPHQSYKCLIFLSMLYLIALIGTTLSNKKIISFPIIGKITAAIFFASFIFTIADVVTEVYGYRECKKMITSGLIAFGLFSASMTLVTYLHSPSFAVTWAATQDPRGYQYIFGNLIQSFLGIALAYLIATYLNAALISKWKILLKGRYFWLRSIGASGIAVFLFNVISDTIIGLKPLLHVPGTFALVVKLVIVSFLFKLLIMIILAYPLTLICVILKKIEGVDVYDYGVNYNPFKPQN